ncbi:uncharacterized protein LOC136032291 [Artemia franciscana]|uniref:Uncharacterized protein n=1 Tax=Artemia franciscana TaxID=6661 RepID=A0AA88IFA3_ARTSF|nr:hypothetical protein QYM36_000254 [Artemia franciscana]
MSGGLSFCGLQQVKGNNGDIKYRQLNRQLFYFVGEIQLRNSEYISFETTFKVKSVQHFKNILTKEVRSKYGFDVGIDIEGCGIESKIASKNNSGESSSKSVKYSRKDFFCYKFRPVGCFTIDTEIRRLTKSAVMDLECLKMKEDALKSLHKFGSHYPAPTNSFHYGGVEISHGSETYIEKKYTQWKTKAKKNSASLKTKIGPINLGGASFEKDMGNNNEVNEGNSRSIDVGFLSCDWVDYSSEEEFINQVLSNPRHGRIITRGHDIVPVWDLIKDQYPVQAEIIRNAWIENEKEMSGDSERRRLASVDESERRRDESEGRVFRLKISSLPKKVKKASGCF